MHYDVSPLLYKRLMKGRYDAFFKQHMTRVQPEKGNETLYVIREVFSGIILAAKNLKSNSAEERNFGNNLEQCLKSTEDRYCMLNGQSKKKSNPLKGCLSPYS